MALDKRWRNLGLIVSAIIIIAVLFFVLQKQGIQKTESELSAAGITAKASEVNFDDMNRLTREKLLDLSNKLEKLAEEEKEQYLKEFNLILKNSADIAVKTKEMSETEAQINKIAEDCDRIALLKEQAQNMSGLKELVDSYSKRVNDFAEKYPEKSVELKIYPVDSGAISENDVETYAQATTYLETICSDGK